jgi:hypothetical protein
MIQDARYEYRSTSAERCVRIRTGRYGRGTRHGSLGPEHAVPTTAQTQEDFSARDMGSNQVVVAVYIPGVERKKFTVYLATS